MALADIVRVTIVRGTKTITQAGFGTPLFLANSAASFGSDKVRTYASLKEVAADFATSDAAYKAASRFFGQERKPRRIKIGKRTAVAAQVNTITPTPVNSATYTVTINGVPFAFTADASATAAEIVAGLIGVINAGSEPVTASGTNDLVLTADVAGLGFSVSVGANLANVATTPNNGLIEDLQAIQQIDDDFYGVAIESRVAGEILAMAGYIETQRKIFGACSADADILTSVNTDVLSLLKAKSYARTFLIYSADQANYPEAAWMGGCMPFDPGSVTWKFKSLVGITASDSLTSTQMQNIVAKFGNYYRTTGGVGITLDGRVVANEWIDTITFCDWLQARVEEGIFGRLVSLPKIPFTDAGTGIIYSEIDAVLKRGIKAGGLAENPPPEIIIPKVADVATQDRQARLLPDVTFTGTLAGAIHELEIEGTVSV